MKYKYCGIFDEEKVQNWMRLHQDVPLHQGKFIPVVFYPTYEIDFYSSPMAIGDVVLFMGKVEGLENYGVFASMYDGKLYWGHKLEDFRQIPKSELGILSGAKK